VAVSSAGDTRVVSIQGLVPLMIQLVKSEHKVRARLRLLNLSLCSPLERC
jgi:hypothetical protein